MTTCCAYHAPNGEVWIGSDSLWSGDQYAAPIRQSKIIRAGPWWLAFASDAVVSYTVASRALEIDDLPRAADVLNWLLGIYRSVIKPIEDPGEPIYYRQQCILASKHGVWELCSDGQLAVPEFDFIAIGSGSRHAYGAGAAMIGDPDNHFADISPRLIVKRSIEIACLFDLHSAPPVIVERVE